MPSPTSASQLIRLILLLLSIIGIYQLIRDYRRKKRFKEQLSFIVSEAGAANVQFDELISFHRYFANREEKLFVEDYRAVRLRIIPKFDGIGLPADQVAMLRQFCTNFDQAAALRGQYNEDFVVREAEKYASFFAGLEQYPLSDDQVMAIVRDEDNNLVIAGAGTGKTTTIAAKVAYLLEKRLALPEELLIISFTNNAVREMRERCARFCAHITDAQHIDIRTFNSFGYFVTRSCSSNELLLAFDGNEDRVKVFLQEQFDELFLSDPAFQRKAVNFLGFFNRPERDEFQFETKNDYLTHEQSFKNVTLDGVKVNSKEEMDIGNFFCLNSVNYEYQRHYPLKEEDRNADHAAYQPDFYLKDHDIWHEHFGIDRNGDVPSWFTARPPYPTARDYYQAGIAWKERIHEKYQTRLIKTYSFENKEGTLIANLKQRLADTGVELRPRSAEELLDLVKESGQFEDFIGLIHTFLSLVKSGGKTPEDIQRGKGDKRLRVFMGVFHPLFLAYENHLQAKTSVDYNDMINHAARHFREGNFTKNYKYILVDEFQDMSVGRYQLLKAIRKQNPGVKLYAVGDDWQSIFRFTGSDLSIITQFEQQFGVSSQTAILKTYRFNEQILQTSSDFVQQNPLQIRKQLSAFKHAPEGHVSFEFVAVPAAGSGTRQQYQQAKSGYLSDVLRQIALLQADATVFLIGRYTFNCPIDLPGLRRKFPLLNLTYHTAHGVKGMTCDYAVLLEVDAGVLGFPSEIADDPILNYLLQEGDSFENAEERRVFYVAITRARHKNYLLFSEGHPSKFVLELQGEADAVSGQAAIRCPECKGSMVRRVGPFSEFYGCVHYPRCYGKVAIAATEQTRVESPIR